MTRETVAMETRAARAISVRLAIEKRTLVGLVFK